MWFLPINPEFVSRLLSVMVHYVHWVGIVVRLDFGDKITVLTFDTSLHDLPATHYLTGGRPRGKEW